MNKHELFEKIQYKIENDEEFKNKLIDYMIKHITSGFVDVKELDIGDKCMFKIK